MSVFPVLHVSHDYKEKVERDSLLHVEMLERKFQNKYTDEREVCQGSPLACRIT